MNLRARRVLENVAKRRGVAVEDIVGKSRCPHIVRARVEVVYIFRQYLRRRASNPDAYSYAQIGQMLGGRDHSTILWAFRKWRRNGLCQDGRPVREFA